MTHDEIEKLIAAFIAEELAAVRPAAPPARDAPIIESGMVDSLGLFKLIAFLEERLAVKIAPEDIVLENFATVGAIVALVQGRR